jgi:hypothetical protein
VIEFAKPEDAAAVTRIVNAAYHAGETRLWLDGWKRTGLESIEAFIARG